MQPNAAAAPWHDGDGTFAFARWATPFENSKVEIRRVEYAFDQSLTIRVRDIETDTSYEVGFPYCTAFRVLDEHGLLELWEMTEKLKGRPGKTTFMVRNHLWTKESPISFLATEGWSFVLATDDDCIEVVASQEASISRSG